MFFLRRRRNREKLSAFPGLSAVPQPELGLIGHPDQVDVPRSSFIPPFDSRNGSLEKYHWYNPEKVGRHWVAATFPKGLTLFYP